MPSLCDPPEASDLCSGCLFNPSFLVCALSSEVLVEAVATSFVKHLADPAPLKTPNIQAEARSKPRPL